MAISSELFDIGLSNTDPNTNTKNDILQSKTDEKLALLSTRKTTLLGLNDADTPVLPEGTLRESSTNGMRYDAVELAHGTAPYDMYGVDNKSQNEYGKSTYSMDRQRQQVAGILGKSEDTLTPQDMIDVGNQQQIQKLADLVRSPNEPRWEAPLIKGAEQTNLTGKYTDAEGNPVYAPLNVEVGVQTNGVDNSGKRALGSILNIQRNENVTDSAAIDPTQNAFAYAPAQVSTADKLRESLDRDSMIGESVDIAQSSLTQMYGKTNKAMRKMTRFAADKLGLEQDTINKWLPETKDIGTIGYGDLTSDELATNEVADKLTGVMAKTREEQAEGNKKSLESVEKGDYVSAAWEQLKILPYTLGDSSGEIALMMAGSPGIAMAVAARVSEDAEEYKKNNGKDPSGAWLLGDTVLNSAALFGEKFVLKSGIGGVLDKAAGKGKLGVATGIAASIVGEAVQEYYDQVQQMYMTQKDGDKTLGEVATSSEAILAPIAGGVAGGVLRGTGEIGKMAIPGFRSVDRPEDAGLETGNTAPTDQQVYENEYTTTAKTKSAELKAKLDNVTPETKIAVDNEAEAYKSELLDNIKSLHGIEDKSGKDIANILVSRDALANLIQDEDTKDRMAKQKDVFIKNTVAELNGENGKEVRKELLDLLEKSDIAPEDKTRLKTELVADAVGRILASDPDRAAEFNAMLNSLEAGGEIDLGINNNRPRQRVSVEGMEETTAADETDIDIKIDNSRQRQRVSWEGILDAADEIEADDINEIPSDTEIKINNNRPRQKVFVEGGETEQTSTEQPKEKAKAKEKTKADNTSTATHTVGLSSRTIEKLAKLVGANPEDMAKALGSAVRDMRIKNMKSVGKEANKVQYEMYYGEKRGIMPTFTKLRKAIETGSSEEVDTNAKELIRRSIDLQTRLAKYELAYNEMYDKLKADAETLLNDGESVSELLELAVDEVTPGDIGKSTEGKSYKIASDDVLKDMLADLVQEGKISKEDAEANKIDTEYKSNPLSIMEAQEEARLHIEEMLDSVGIVAPTIDTRIVSADEDLAALNEELTSLNEKFAKAKVDSQRTKINKYIAKVNAKIKEAEGRGRRLAVEVENKMLDLDAFMETSAGLKLGEVLEKGKDYIKPAKPAKTGVMTKVAKSVEDAQFGKYESEIPQADVVTEVTKVMDPAKVQEAVEEVKALEAKKAKIEQISKPRVEAVSTAIDTKIAELEDAVVDTLGKGYEVYAETKEALAELYAEVDALEGEKAKNANLVKLIQQIRNGEGDIDAAKAEIEAILASKEQNKEKGILNTLIRMYAKIGAVARLADRVMKWIGKKPGNQGKRFADLLKSVDEENAKIDTQIKAKKEEARIKQQTMMYEVGKANAKPGQDKLSVGDSILTEVKRLRDEIKEWKRRRKEAVRRGSSRVKDINAKIRELKSKLVNTKLVDDMATNSSATLVSKDLETVYERLKKTSPDATPEEQPMNPWGLMSIRQTILGALWLESITTMLGDTNGAVFDKFRRATKSTLENKLNLDTKKGLDYKLYNDPAFAVAVNAKGELNDVFTNAVAMVTVDYVANGMAKLDFKSDSDLARMLGISEYEVDGKIKKAFQKAGSFKKVVTYSLGKAVASNMGLSPKDSMSDDHWDKIVQGLGQMALLSMEGRYIADLDKTTMSAETYAAAMGDKLDTTIEQITIDDKGKAKGLPIPMVKSLGKLSDKAMAEMRELAKALNTELDVFGVAENYHTSKPSNVDTKEHKVRGGLNESPEKSQKVLRKLEVNESVLNDAGMKELMLMADTKEAMLDMLKDYTKQEYLDAAADAKTITQDAYDSAISRNREIESAVDELLTLKERIDNGSILNKLYFRWFFSKNGRFFIDSAGINPQTEKLLHRWLITSKDQERVWDMRNEQDAMYFKISVVQAFDGSKLEDENGVEVNYGAGIDKANIQDVIEAYDKIMEAADKDISKLTLIGKKAAHPGHAALAIAGIKAMKASKDKKFTATMLIEYDAVTSGFILKLLQTPILSGEGKLAEWIAKGGIFEGGDKRIEGKGTADVIGGSILAEKTVVGDTVVPKDTKVVGVVDAYKSQGHTMHEMAQGKNSVMAMDGGNIVFKAGRVEVKGESVPIDKKGIVGALQSDNLIEAIFETKNGEMVMEYSYDAKGSIKVGPKLTKFGRDLFKPGFMTFNYGSSLKSIKRKVGEVLAEKVMTKLMAGEVGTVALDTALGRDAKVLVKEYAVGSTKQTKIGKELVTGGKSYDMALQDVLEYVIAESYGEAITGAMEREFGELMKLNESIINSTKVMFRLWKAEFEKLVNAEKGLVTKARKKEIFAELAKKFPLIRAPYTEGELDKVGINTDELTGYKSRKIGNTQTAVINREFATMTVQLMTRQLAEAHAAGAVLPIHWIDGTIMAEILGKYAGVLGVHDAIVLGKAFAETVRDMNKATLEIGRDYDMVGAVMESLLDSVEGVDIKTLMKEQIGKGDSAISYAEVIYGMREQYNKVQEARKEFYSTDKVGGNIAGHAGTTYTMQASKKEGTGILSKINGKSVKDIQEQIDMLIKECK